MHHHDHGTWTIDYFSENSFFAFLEILGMFVFIYYLLYSSICSNKLLRITRIGSQNDHSN
jgi:hypothetical protein